MKMTLEEKRERRAERAKMAARLAECHAAARAVVATGRCPQCGAGLRRNISLLGWWQCEQYGAPKFRKNPNKPDCSWQGFTD